MTDEREEALRLMKQVGLYQAAHEPEDEFDEDELTKIAQLIRLALQSAQPGGKSKTEPAIAWPFASDPPEKPQFVCQSCGTRYDLEPVLEELKRAAQKDVRRYRYVRNHNWQLNGLVGANLDAAADAYIEANGPDA